MHLFWGQVIWEWYSEKNNSRGQGAVISTQTHNSTDLPAIESGYTKPE